MPNPPGRKPQTPSGGFSYVNEPPVVVQSLNPLEGKTQYPLEVLVMPVNLQRKQSKYLVLFSKPSRAKNPGTLWRVTYRNLQRQCTPSTLYLVEARIPSGGCSHACIPPEVNKKSLCSKPSRVKNLDTLWRVQQC